MNCLAKVLLHMKMGKLKIMCKDTENFLKKILYTKQNYEEKLKDPMQRYWKCKTRFLTGKQY